MNKQVKDIYLCICCPNGYVRGLREIVKIKNDEIITSNEIDEMNQYINKYMKILQMKNKKVIIFDLDGTLTESKSDVSKDMVQIFNDITKKYNINIAIISGCNYTQLHSQFISKFNKWEAQLDRYYLLPTCGAQLYEYAGYDGGWVQQYSHDLNLREKASIYNAFSTAIRIYNSKCHIDRVSEYPTYYGEIAEDRGSQITFSLLGQEAPLEEKIAFDPNGKKRQMIIKLMQNELYDDFEIRIGGTTSIDVTKIGINKEFGVKKIIEHLCVEPKNAIFVGDALYEGGNDYPVIMTGVECVATTGPEETIRILKSEFFGE